MTRAVLILREAGIPFSVHRYRYEPSAAAYGMEAAEKLGVSPHRLFKTLVIRLDDRQEAVALVPASNRLDLKVVATAFAVKSAAMASPGIARRTTGCEIGGISPLGHRKPMPVIVDETALDHKTLYISAGKRGVQVELKPEDLIRVCRATLGKISK